jgi:hypothetical protein
MTVITKEHLSLHTAGQTDVMRNVIIVAKQEFPQDTFTQPELSIAILTVMNVAQ